MWLCKKTSVAVHNGTFHADDVCAVATLSLLFEGPDMLNKKIHIIRTRDVAILDKVDYVADVGAVYDPEKNRFDHHQAGGAGARPNGIPYASFGLVWKKFGAQVCEKICPPTGENSNGNKVAGHEIAARLDEVIVQAIDAPDNGVSLSTEKIAGAKSYDFHAALFSFNPTWIESDANKHANKDVAFFEAVTIAKKIIVREIERAYASFIAANQVESAYQNATDKRLIILEKGYPWARTLLAYAEPLFVVSPSDTGATITWHVRGVPQSEGSFEVKKPLPVAWAGKNGEEFQRISGVPDAIFAHKNLFLAGAQSREGAIALAQKAIHTLES